MAYRQRFRDIRDGGAGSRFTPGVGNPQYGGYGAGSTRQPTGRRTPTQPTAPARSFGGGTATVNTTGPTYGPPSLESRQVQGPRHTYNPGVHNRVQGSGNWWAQRNQGGAAFNEPDIPGERTWEGDRWKGELWEGGVADTTALVDATDALINEQLGGTMSEAARRFGQAGALMSGGGLGGGYAGTLAESERGAMRDRAEMRHRYRFQAEQADAERRLRAHEGYQSRDLGAHEGYEGRRFGAHGMGADYDRWKYGAELGRAGRDQRQNAIDLMMAQYG